MMHARGVLRVLSPVTGVCGIRGKTAWCRIRGGFGTDCVLPGFGRFRYIGAMRIEAAARDVLRGVEGLVCAYLYGSRARGEARLDSDVDLAVLLEHSPPATFEGLPLDLETALEHAIGLPVQLVILNDAPADLVHRVLRDGRLLLERDPSARVRFEVRRRNEYFDLLPVLREYRNHGTVGEAR